VGGGEDPVFGDAAQWVVGFVGEERQAVRGAVHCLQQGRRLFFFGELEEG